MTRSAYIRIAALILLALLALLVYSLDRTSWLLAQYELSQAGTLAHWLGLSPLALGVAAALVIEIGAVALVAGDVLALERSAIKRYSTAGLFVVLSVQALANLLAGYLRGWATVEQALTAHDVTADTAWYIAGFSWILSSAAVPALIFILSKLAAHVVRLAMSAEQAKASKKEPIADFETAPLSGTPAQAAQDGPGASESAKPYELPVTPFDTNTALLVVPDTSESQATRYFCDHCGNELASKQAKGNAARFGCSNLACPGRANRKEVRTIA